MEEYKIEIKTDGTIRRTNIYANGELIGWITKLIFEANELYPMVERIKLNEYGRPSLEGIGDLEWYEQVSLIQHIEDTLSGKYKYKLKKNNGEEVTFMTEVED